MYNFLLMCFFPLWQVCIFSPVLIVKSSSLLGVTKKNALLNVGALRV